MGLGDIWCITIVCGEFGGNRKRYDVNYFADACTEFQSFDPNVVTALCLMEILIIGL